MHSCLVFQIDDVWLGDRCEGLVEWRELMGRSAAQTHPGSPCLLPLRLLIGFTTLPCCSHTNAGTLGECVKAGGKKPKKKQRVTHTHTRTHTRREVSEPIQRLTPLLPFDPSLLHSSPTRGKKTQLICSVSESALNLFIQPSFEAVPYGAACVCM